MYLQQTEWTLSSLSAVGTGTSFIDYFVSSLNAAQSTLGRYLVTFYGCTLSNECNL